MTQIIAVIIAGSINNCNNLFAGDLHLVWTDYNQSAADTLHQDDGHMASDLASRNFYHPSLPHILELLLQNQQKCREAHTEKFNEVFKRR